MMLTSAKGKVLTFSLIPVVLLLALAGGFMLWRAAPAPAPAAPPAASGPPASPVIEQRWGVRVVQVGVTADGGLLDFRYLVLDPDKAMAMQQDKAAQPFLIDEATGTRIDSSPTMSHKHQLNAGLTYFDLYRNPKGVVQPGRLVTVVVGDLRLEHLVAR